MVKCECGKIWYYKDPNYEWQIVDDKPKVFEMGPALLNQWQIIDDKVKAFEMASGPPDFEGTTLTVYQCPCGKVNAIVAWTTDTAYIGYGNFLHPDWEEEDIDAYIKH